MPESEPGPPAWMPGGSASPTGRTPQERSRVPHQRSGVTSKRSSPTRSQPCQQPVCASRLVSKKTRPWRRMNCAFSSTAGIAPCHSRSQAMPCSFSSSAEAQALQRLEHLDLEGTDRGVHAVAELPRRAHHAVAVAALHAGEGVLGGQVRVLAQPHHHEQLVGRGVQVEVVAVVEVAVAGGDVANRLAGLVDREVVPGREHGGLLAARAGRVRASALPTIQVEKYCEPPP